MNRIKCLIYVFAMLSMLLLSSGCDLFQPKPVPLTVASVSMLPKTDKAANMQTFEKYMRDAARQGAHLVVFPQFALQQNPGESGVGYTPTAEEKDYVAKTAETIPGESTNWLIQKAKEVGIYVVFGMAERGENGKLYSTSVFLGPKGIISSHRASKLWDGPLNGNEDLIFYPDWELGTTVESPIGKVGLRSGLEMMVSPVYLISSGAQLITTVAAIPNGSDYGGMYRYNAVDNAQMCNCWHVVANQAGNIGHQEMYGHSLIINPKGDTVADTGDAEGMIVVKTDLMLEPKTLGLPASR